MVIVMQQQASEPQIEAVVDRLGADGLETQRSSSGGRTVLAVHGVLPDVDVRRYAVLDGVADVFRITSPYKFASRAWSDDDTRIRVADLEIGGDEVIVTAGPCAVESEEQIEAVAAFVARQGARMLRGGAFKPRTSPYSFQGLGEEGLRLLRNAADRHGLAVVTEVMRPSQVELVAGYADVLQIGARNMQNFDLLREIGRTDIPVLLKRGMAATVDDWLMSAEHIIASGNRRVILCERGIRTFETSTRNTLDLSSVPILQQRSHLPVFVDPSHGVGLRDLVTPLSRAAVAVGAHGLLVEVHPDPAAALSDGPQSLHFDQFAGLMDEVRRVARAVGRRVAAPAVLETAAVAPERV